MRFVVRLSRIAGNEEVTALLRPGPGWQIETSSPAGHHGRTEVWVTADLLIEADTQSAAVHEAERTLEVGW